MGCSIFWCAHLGCSNGTARFSNNNLKRMVWEVLGGPFWRDQSGPCGHKTRSHVGWRSFCIFGKRSYAACRSVCILRNAFAKCFRCSVVLSFHFAEAHPCSVACSATREVLPMQCGARFAVRSGSSRPHLVWFKGLREACRNNFQVYGTSPTPWCRVPKESCFFSLR